MNQKETNQQKTLFKSYYCAGCKQKKPCQLLTGWDSEWKSYCCACHYEREREKCQDFNSYEEVLASKQIEREKTLRQLQLLRSYRGCPQCRSKEVDTYSLFENNRLICQPCLMNKTGGSSSPISFTGQIKWYRKWWGINLGEWLDNYQRLPVNKNCAERCKPSAKQKWLKNKQHLDNCQCLEVEAKEDYLLFANSLWEMEEKLKECRCVKSEKVRINSDNYVWCGSCDRTIEAASKKRVIKNRNDVRFWGIGSEWRVLCLECIGKEFYKEMEGWQRKKWREYRRRGYR